MEIGHGYKHFQEIKRQLENKSADELTPQEKWRLEHIRLHEQHEGHDSMHSAMILIFIATMIVAQIFLIQWRQRHNKSYQPVSLLGLWVVPLVYCVISQWWRFIFTWLVFSCITALVLRKSLQKPIDRTTPRY